MHTDSGHGCELHAKEVVCINLPKCLAKVCGCVCAIDVPTAINQRGTDLNASTASSDVAGGLQDGPDTHTHRSESPVNQGFRSGFNNHTQL